MKEPKIRLKGFQGEWKSSKYEEVFSIIGDTGHNVQKNEYCERGSYPVVDQSKEYIVGYTDKVMPIDGSKGLIIFGDHTREIKYIDFPFCTGADGTRILKSEQSFDARFMYYVCHSLNIPNTGYNRHFKYIQEAIYNAPETKAEQQSIASYFQHLDSLIQVTTKKIESLKQVKAASLQSMFPQEGETTPRVRFKGFEGEWEKVSFGQLGSVAMCKRIFKDQTMDKGEVPFYKIGTFAMEPDAYISKELFIEYKSKFSFPQKGDILISAAGTIGRTIQYNGEDAYFQDSNIVWLMHGNEIDNTFLMYIYSLVKWNGLEGATIKRLYNNIILETEFLLPPVEEQRAIASFFTNLDRQISLQTQRLEKLKQIKAACLDNMFV